MKVNCWPASSGTCATCLVLTERRSLLKLQNGSARCRSITLDISKGSSELKRVLLPYPDSSLPAMLTQGSVFLIVFAAVKRLPIPSTKISRGSMQMNADQIKNQI